MKSANVRQPWDRQAKALRAQQGWGARRIARELRDRYERSKNDDGGSKLLSPPPEGTVRHILDRMTEDDYVGYRLFRWPESMESDDALPWEASKACLELLADLQTRGRRPTIRYCRWFYRVTQAVPDRPFEERRRLADQLELTEFMSPDDAERSRREAEASMLGQRSAPTFERLKQQAENVPDSTGSTFAEGHGLRVAAREIPGEEKNDAEG